MNCPPNDTFRRFFTLRETGELREIVGKASSSKDLRDRALARYAATWSAFNDADDHAPFHPLRHVSEDLSSAVFGRIPAVFLGSNDWAARATMPQSDATKEIGSFEELAFSAARACPGAKVVAMIAPEKDYLASHLYSGGADYRGVSGAIDTLGERLRSGGIPLVFEQALRGMAEHLAPEELEYYDTHLPAKIYLQIFAQAMKAAGFDWSTFSGAAKIRQATEFLDLAEKLAGAPGNPARTTIATMTAPGARQIRGSNTFARPLRDTWQSIQCPKPHIDARALVLGDSHSSIFQKDKLTGLFGRAFRETDFFWNPWAVHGFQPARDYDYVFLEISQRFLLRGTR